MKTLEDLNELNDLAMNISEMCSDLFFQTIYDVVFEEYGGECDEEALAVVHNIVFGKAIEHLITELSDQR